MSVLSRADIERIVDERLKAFLEYSLRCLQPVGAGAAQTVTPQAIPSQNAASTPNPPKRVAIADLQDGAKHVNVTGKIVELSESRTVQNQKVMDATLADENATIKLVLWNNDIDRVEQGSQVKVEQGYVTSYKGELQLNIGKWGKLTIC